MRARLSQKGLDLCGRVNTLYDRHIDALFSGAMSAEELAAVNKSLGALERFWTERLRHGP